MAVGNKRSISQKISDKTTMDIFPGKNKAEADKEIAEYAKDVELIKLYGDDAMRSKTFNTRKQPEKKGKGKGIDGVYRATTAAEDKASKKKKFLEKVGGTPEKPVIRKAKGGSVRAFNNGGAVMSGRGPKFKGIK